MSTPKFNCYKCQHEDDKTAFDSFQRNNVIYYECVDTSKCCDRCKQIEYEHHYGGLKAFGVKVEDLVKLPHKCRCMQQSYHNKLTDKYYTSNFEFGNPNFIWMEFDKDHLPSHFP
jgi:hypothetical protein